MGIGSMKGLESMSSRPMGGAQPADSVIKGIQEEISEARRQRQQLSSKEELPAAEKVKKRQELQQKISDLNRELRQRQADVRKEQQKEALAKEKRTSVSSTENADNKDTTTKDTALKAAAGQNPKTNNIKANALKTNDVKTDNVKADNTRTNNAKPKAAGLTSTQNDNVHNAGAYAEKTGGKALLDKDKTSQLQDFDIPKKEWKALIESDTAREQRRKQEIVIARIEGGIAILKSEIKLDEARGADVDKKQDELKKQSAKLQQASAAQFSSPVQLKQTAEKPVSAKAGATSDLSRDNKPTEQQPLFKDIAVSLTT